MDLNGIMNSEEVDPGDHNKTPTSTNKTAKSSSSKASKSSKNNSSAGGGSSHRRGGHNRMYHTLLTGTKLRHLKKKDGDPLWRRDIQYDFLYSIFYNEERVFTNPFTEEKGNTFADVYIDAMAKSSKTSKILREKLLADRQASLNMAMVCLLVNIGRMNTTLNFFPEMKAQLRTYHPIPSLQVYTDQTDQYKQLQDAPRLKSILKGACEDRPGEATNLDELARSPWTPRTNAVNLIFILATYAPRVDEKFFVGTNHDFFDLLMAENLSSESRGKAFLWLMWAYLETDLSDEQIRENPFSPGGKLPEFVTLTPEEVEKENVDNETEKEFGEKMTKERLDYIENANAATLNAASAVLIDSSGSPNQSQNMGTPTPAASSSHNGASTRMRKRDSMLSNGSVSSTSTPPMRSLRHRDSIPDYTGASAEKAFDEEQQQQQATPLNKDGKPKSNRGGKRIKGVSNAGGKVKLIVKAPGKKGSKSSTIEARTRKCQAEIERMLRSRDRRNRRVRYQQGSISRTWNRIKDLDPIYISDDEGAVQKEDEAVTTGKRGGRKKQQQSSQPQSSQTSEQQQPQNNNNNNSVNGTSSTHAAENDSNNFNSSFQSTTTIIQPPTLRAGTVFADDDYGEEALSVARAIRRSLRWTTRWKAEQSQPPSSFNNHTELNGDSTHAPVVEKPRSESASKNIMRLDNLIDPDGDVVM